MALPDPGGDSNDVRNDDADRAETALPGGLLEALEEAAGEEPASVRLEALATAAAAAISESFKLVASDNAAGDQFGVSISISGDRALVGALDDDNGSLSGSAYVFDFDGSSWTETAKLLASDAAAVDSFGTSVSLSGDRAIVGAPGDDDNGSSTGSAYIFDFDGSTWIESEKLLASDGASFDQFGWSVSLSGDRALIGAPGDDDNGNSSGSAYVFDFDGSSWSQSAKLLAADGATDDGFGSSVSLSGDRALLGALRDDNISGSAYVFDFDGVSWSQSAKLLASDGAGGDFFGFSVALSGDRALVGAYRDDDNGTDSGSAYVFNFDGTLWSESTKLLAADGIAGDQFGRSVGLSGDRALIGAPGDDDNGSSSGSAYVFDFDGSSWTETAKLLASDGAASDFFGSSVSLSGDRALVGAHLDDDNGGSSGSAYVFDSDVNTAPTVGPITAPLDPVEVGTLVEASSPFSDPDAGDTHTAEWDWGDGTTSNGSISSGEVTGSHTYGAAGIYTLTLTVTDAEGASGDATFEYVVIYDPDGGFVTGGGFIDSPPGAYANDPDLTGTAHFGFVSKYKKGQSTPVGETKFQFKVAGLNFHSDVYEWLVISGAKASYKGKGTISGAGDYGFLLVATDEELTPSTDTDLFRIKIWDRLAGDAVVYDNKMGESDDSDAGAEISSGSIVVNTGDGKAGKNGTAEADLPAQFALQQNYPNPFNPTTEIHFALPEAAHVSLVVYDLMGREVVRLVESVKEAGYHGIRWEARDLSSGVYVYRIEAGDFTESKVMTLLK